MGFLQAITSSINQTSNNMYKGFYMCDSLSNNTLIQRGRRHRTPGNMIHGDPDIITNGSIISVADGQAAIVVLNGRITSIFTEPGEYELVEGGNASLFEKEGIKHTTHAVLKRVEFGGEYAGYQRLYYVNTKEILNNTFATTQPIPIKIHDVPGENGLNVLMQISGRYSMRITRPDILYRNITGNVLMSYSVSQLASQIKSELDTEMYSITGRLSEKKLTITELPALTKIIGSEIQQLMNEFLEPLRGISISHISISSIAVDSHHSRLVSHLQEIQIYAGSIAAMQAQNKSTPAASSGVQKSAAPSANKIIRLKWTCTCGRENTGKFCEECGAKGNLRWRCTCGKENGSKFCEECGKALE